MSCLCPLPERGSRCCLRCWPRAWGGVSSPAAQRTPRPLGSWPLALLIALPGLKGGGVFHSLTHDLPTPSFTHSLIHPFTRSLIHHSHIHSFRSLTHSLIRSFTDALIHPFTHLLAHSCTRPLVAYPIHPFLFLSADFTPPPTHCIIPFIVSFLVCPTPSLG